MTNSKNARVDLYRMVAVYVQKRELKYACMGGSSNVPLGFISLTENLLMVAMAIWMPLSATVVNG